MSSITSEKCSNCGDEKRWIRDIRLAHVHGVSVGMKKNLSYNEFKNYWIVLCSILGQESKAVDDEMLFNTINELHGTMIDHMLTLSTDKDIPEVTRSVMIELAAIIQALPFGERSTQE